MKPFCRQRLPEFPRVRKKTVDIDILTKSRNIDRRKMQPVRITS